MHYLIGWNNGLSCCDLCVVQFKRRIKLNVSAYLLPIFFSEPLSEDYGPVIVIYVKLTGASLEPRLSTRCGVSEVTAARRAFLFFTRRTNVHSMLRKNFFLISSLVPSTKLHAPSEDEENNVKKYLLTVEYHPIV